MMLLLALLLAAPERVVLVAKPAGEPGFFEKAGDLLRGAVRRLHLRDDPEVDEGNALAAQNDPEGALRAYDRALERLKDSPELHYDRAGQMLKLGSDHAMRAHDEAMAAMQAQDPRLKSGAAFDLGLSYEEMGHPDEAIKAYQQALSLDPDDVDSKVNLELLLKQEERKKQMPQQQQQESKNQQQQQQQQKDKSKGDEQQKNQQQQAGQKDEKKEEQKQEPQPGGQQQKEQQAQQQQQEGQQEKQVDRSEAQRLLDALRASEKNLQVWRFAKDKRKEARRGDVEKDW